MGATPEIAGLILCGGRSSRMGGGDKCLLPLGRGTMLGAVIGRASPQVGPLAISANGDPQRFSGFALPVLADPIPDHAGPLSGILAGLEWAADSIGSSRIVSFAGDTPFLPRDVVARLSASLTAMPGAIAVAASGGRSHPVCALWSTDLRASLRAFLAEGSSRSVAAFLARHPVVEVPFPFVQRCGQPVDPFFNVNRPRDLARAAELAEDLVP